jgi:hypothetical protein
MNINRNTYEEFFLLYVDNELSQAERRQVEAFIEENPDLRPELDMLHDVVLRPEEPATFNKEVLFRHNFPVTELNYEEYFVLYGDDELTREEKEYVEQFVYRHPQHQAEFELILRSRLQVDSSIVHPDKESLYRYEKKDRPVVYMQWMKIAVAAAILLFVGGAGWYFSTQNQNATLPLANVPTEKVPSTTSQTPATNQPATTSNQEEQLNPTIASNKPANPGHDKSVDASNSITAISKKSSKKSNISSPSIVKQDRQQEPVFETKEVAVPKVELIAANTEPKAPIIDEALSEEQIRGGSAKTEYVEASFAEDNNVVYVANTTVNKKNKLRGVFRKASRIFEKATNIDPTEGDRAVRIAGFEIALK